jgi:hypothetical protein
MVCPVTKEAPGPARNDITPIVNDVKKISSGNIRQPRHLLATSSGFKTL